MVERVKDPCQPIRDQICRLDEHISDAKARLTNPNASAGVKEAIKAAIEKLTTSRKGFEAHLSNASKSSSTEECEPLSPYARATTPSCSAGVMESAQQ